MRTLKHILSYFWKLPLCGIVFFTGMAVGGGLLPALGFQAPEMPAGTDANTVALWFLMGSLVLAFALSFVSRRLQVSWLGRSLILFGLTWVFGAIGMVLESAFFMTTDAVSSFSNSLFTILNFLLPSLFLSLMAAALFRPVPPIERLESGFTSRSASDWLWRLGAALVAYPLVYIAFGLIVNPFVQEYYTTGQFELALPTWGQLIPLQLARSALFLLAALPVVRWWRGSPRGLWLALGLSIFVLTAFMAVITAYWFPWQMRLFHGLELLADALVYTGVLVAVFKGGSRRRLKVQTGIYL